ncbi:hypothetical protein [Marinobacter sp. X15-166B]|uniref:hypothetical protein n=1 Tax=Marinobacter sp. X15-166B TaxID=1897620 RepID=UPI00085C90E2|nr:hypothetical protein [Marinobacter sp. X15-166B]OEY66268.1 hypothetical protein BG841_07230 [Marinobacter sp. X15-166B]
MNQNTFPRFQQLVLSQQASIRRRFSPDDLDLWGQLAQLEQPPTSVPEPLIAGLFSCLLGMELPGHGTNYLKQWLAFEQHARADEELTATVTVSRLRPDKALVNLTTICTGEGDRFICRGEALVLFQC